MKNQNTSHAVMAQRDPQSKDGLDYFPTPPWATRALMEHVISHDQRGGSCLEPACGEGHMAETLMEYFRKVAASDIHDYGFSRVEDFLNGEFGVYDWIITNPPFNLAEQFISRAQKLATAGVAMLVRTSFLESVGRYERLFSDNPPNIVAVFTERVPMVKGRLDRKASSATSYSWLVWRQKGLAYGSRCMWIPPCRKELERDTDYEARP